MAMRLGFPVKVLGQKGLRSNDARKWQSNPHFRTSIDYLKEVFAYCAKRRISMYRMSSDIAPYATHPDMPQFHGQIRECSRELCELGALAREHGLRLSLHPSQFIVINSPDPELRRKSIWDLEVQSEILECMEQPAEAIVIVHAGGAYGDIDSGMERWIRAYETLSDAAKRRLVLENDDTSLLS